MYFKGENCLGDCISFTADKIVFKSSSQGEYQVGKGTLRMDIAKGTEVMFKARTGMIPLLDVKTNTKGVTFKMRNGGKQYFVQDGMFREFGRKVGKEASQQFTLTLRDKKGNNLLKGEKL